MPELLAYWIKERERIRERKEAQQARPWSDDPVFQRTYFTNVHREHDKVTRWIRQNYTLDLFGEFYEPAIVAARIFNNPATLEAFKLKWFPVNQYALENQLIEWGNSNKTWGGAYVITTHGQKMPKVTYCVKLLLEAQERLPFTKYGYDTCESYYHGLMRIDGIGSFLAAQIIADLKNTEGHPLHGSGDWLSFSAPGPGSLRGLSWYFGTKITPRMYEGAIAQVADNLEWDHCMQDLQNCLCEFDKYCRVSTGTGRSKRKYEGA